MENYSVQVPPYTVGPEAYRQIEKQCHIYGKSDAKSYQEQMPSPVQ